MYRVARGRGLSTFTCLVIVIIEYAFLGAVAGAAVPGTAQYDTLSRLQINPPVDVKNYGSSTTCNGAASDDAAFTAAAAAAA